MGVKETIEKNQLSFEKINLILKDIREKNDATIEKLNYATAYQVDKIIDNYQKLSCYNFMLERIIKELIEFNNLLDEEVLFKEFDLIK